MMAKYSIAVWVFSSIIVGTAVAQEAAWVDGINVGPGDAKGRGMMERVYEVAPDALCTPADAAASELVTVPEEGKESAEPRFPVMLEGDGKVQVGAVELTKPAGRFTPTKSADTNSDARFDEAPEIGRSVAETLAEAAARWGADWPAIVERLEKAAAE